MYLLAVGVAAGAAIFTAVALNTDMLGGEGGINIINNNISVNIIINNLCVCVCVCVCVRVSVCLCLCVSH